MNRNKGFTLLELLISLALFSVIYVVAHGTLSTILSGSQALDDEQRRWRKMDILFTLMQEDLQFANNRKIRGVDGFVLPALIGQATDIRAVSNPTLEFSRSGLHVLAGKTETGSRRVAYRLKENILYREIWQTMDRKYDAKPTTVQVLSDVDQFEARFLAKDGQWLNSWPNSQYSDEVLPQAVDIKVTQKDHVVINRVFHVNG